MKNITKICAFAAVSLTFMVAACGDDETTSGPSGPTTSSGAMGGTGGDGGDGGGGTVPPKPNLGGQIDRMGRAAIATATHDRFGTTTHDTSVDTWNANADPGTWAATYAESIAGAIGVLDSLDEVCGNAFVYNFGAANCPDDGPTACYGTFATVLANDWLVINLAGSPAVGPQYLGVEGETAGLLVPTVIDPDNTGGRKLEHDVILLSYSVLSGAVPFDDGISVPTPTPLELFPYLAPAL
jgi:hypothetical protein